MTLHKKLSGLYAITDASPLPHLLKKVEQALKGGVHILQYRHKTGTEPLLKQEATALLSLCQQYQVPLIINDNIELASHIGADGVHLGKNDKQLTLARQQLGTQAIIGVSCYNDLSLAIAAEEQGANYIALGSLFSSSTKPNAPRASLALIKEAQSRLSSPICAIGGITTETAPLAYGAGADMVAVISSLFSATDIQQQALSFTDASTA